MQYITDEYYKEVEKIRINRTKNPENIGFVEKVEDKNNAIFSFNFGLSLLDLFIKIEFEPTFGVSILESFTS